MAVLNDYEVKVAKLKGEFVWHTHEDTDELFLVVSGRLRIRLRDADVVLKPGELFVVPRGVEHCPVADEETAILLFEPTGTINTGDAGGPMTKAAEVLSRRATHGAGMSGRRAFWLRGSSFESDLSRSGPGNVTPRR